MLMEPMDIKARLTAMIAAWHLSDIPMNLFIMVVIFRIIWNSARLTDT